MKSRIVIVSAIMVILVAAVAAVGAYVPADNDPGQISADQLQVVDVPLAASEVASSSPAKTTSGHSRYIIQFEEPALATYAGGIGSLAPTSPAARGEARLSVESAASTAYLGYLEAQQATFIAEVESLLNRPLEVHHQYMVAINGMAVSLSPEEAAQVATLDNVKHIEEDYAAPLDTDAGPEWIGASGIWDGSNTGGLPGTMGEGVVVGVLDTGINMDHPSFAAVGGDGYVHTNPYGSGNFVGWCNPANINYDPAYVCNDKLIGAWDYADASWGNESDGPEDNDGHGSHTSSTAAGNVVSSTLYAPTAAISDTISGVAPHANIIMYDVCGATGSCFFSDSVAAINQAIIDGVDVLNESIGIGGDTFSGSKQQAYLGAFSAGLVVSRSAGNSGPGAGTVGPEPVWAMSSAALTHNRALFNSLIDMTGGTNPPADIQGLGFTSGYGPAEIVYAGDYTSTLTATPELCGVGDIGDFTPPWPAGTFNGEIVVCDRGTFGRVEKGANVLAAGAGGYVLADNGAGVVSDGHVLPGVHISQADGVILKSWLISTTVQTATIAGVSVDYSVANGDVMAGFSSRGSAPVDVVKPDIGSPGVSIWAAVSDNPGGPDEGAEYGFNSGTSMASPHTAGAAALLRALHPDWSVSAIRSALMTTATTENTVKEDGATATDAFDVGAGRTDLTQAGEAGLVLEETVFAFTVADASTANALNLPSMQDGNCYQTCSWNRTVTSVAATSVNWVASTSSPDGVQLMVEPPTFTLAAGASQVMTITADVLQALPEDWAFATVTLTPDDSSIPNAHLPVATYVATSTDAATVLKEVDIFHAEQGQTLTYTITVANTGGVTNTYNLTDVVPSNATYVTGSATGGLVYSSTTDMLTWSGDLGPSGIFATEVPTITGYVSLGGLGVTPFGCPSDCDDGGWVISGIDFNYLGQDYSSVIWSMNGTLEVGTASGVASPATNVPLPNPAAPNNLLAPWWDDLNPGAGGNIYAANLTAGAGFSFLVFEWENVPRFGDLSSTATFQIWHWREADLTWFSYAPGGLVGTVNSSTVGAEDGAGDAGDTLYHNGVGSLPSAAHDVWIEYLVSPPAVLSFQATVNASLTDPNILNELTLTGGSNSYTAWANSVLNVKKVYLPIVMKE